MILTRTNKDESKSMNYLVIYCAGHRTNTIGEQRSIFHGMLSVYCIHKSCEIQQKLHLPTEFIKIEIHQNILANPGNRYSEQSVSASLASLFLNRIFVILTCILKYSFPHVERTTVSKRNGEKVKQKEAKRLAGLSLIRGCCCYWYSDVRLIQDQIHLLCTWLTARRPDIVNKV